MTFFSPFGKVILIKASSSPIRSTPPCANTDSSAISYSLYLMEELPQFNTNIFISVSLKWEWLFLCILSLTCRNGHHIVNIIYRATTAQIVHRTGNALKDRANGN